jgi:hypothetical protein
MVANCSFLVSNDKEYICCYVMPKIPVTCRAYGLEAFALQRERETTMLFSSDR